MENRKIDYENKIIYQNSILSVIFKIVSAGLSLISAPLLLYCLGEEKFGAWVSFLSLISWIYYCDLGIGNGLRNKLANSLALNDFEASRKYIGISYALISSISVVVFLIAFVAVNYFDIGGFLGLTFADENINMCLIVAILLACINFVISLANNMLYALQKAGMVNLFSVIGQAVFILSLLLYAITGTKLILYMVIAEGGSQFLKNVIETLYVYRKNPELKFSIKDVDKDYSQGILSFGLQMFIVQIAALILNATDNLVILKLYGTAAVTPYSVCYRYFSMINTFYVALITPLLSAYTAAYARNDSYWIFKSLKKNGLTYAVFVVGTIIAAFMFKPFSLIWLQKELIYENGLIFAMALYFIVLMFNHIFSTFLTGISHVKETTIATLIGTIINVPLSVFLAKNVGLGTTGVMWGSILSLAIATFVAPLVTMQEIKIMKKKK